MATPVSAGFRRGKIGLVLLGVDLKDAREEVFVRMVCDGLTLGVAYARAGFKGSDVAAHQLFHLPRIQTRAAAILEARRTQGVVTLPEVTDMLKRVFAGAQSEGEYSAAHNAAFSLARLYGHVTDKATLEVIRRPSRDPDAPGEQVLSDWVAALPVVGGSSPGLWEAELGLGSQPLDPLEGPTRSAPAALLGPEPPMLSADNKSQGPDFEGPGLQLDLFNDTNGLAGSKARVRIGNGAPVGPVTGTPTSRAQSGLLESTPPDSRAHSTLSGPRGPEQKRVPRRDKQVPVKKRGKKRQLKPHIPSAKVLFG